MGVFALKRALWAVVLYLGLSTVTFVLFFVLPHLEPAIFRRTQSELHRLPQPADTSGIPSYCVLVRQYII